MANREPADGPGSDPTLAATTEPGARTRREGGTASPGDRYLRGELLGRGGMGEVWRFTDAHVGRDVAIKVMRSDGDDEALQRFLREARLQGQLEHPAIVPVYDIGDGGNASPYFTMKQLRGMTLQTVLERVAAGDEEVRARFGLRRLLTDLTRAAQAVAYAHSKGVVHRDLKPGNIMFGDFGEVYVLDWGIAKVRGQDEPAASSGGLRLGDSSQTRDGSVLGTLGYMPPEQLEAAEAVDGRADIYALGAVLFEILAGERLHVGGSVLEVIEATQRGSEARPTVRAPDRGSPPELDDVCVTATAQRPTDRYAGVEAMVAAIERFLDGDRDLARRRELACEHVERARARVDSGLGDHQARAAAMREAGHAVAFDPGNVDAARLLSRLLLEPPATVPPEVEEQLRQEDREQSVLQAKIGARSAVGWLLLVPVIVWMGVRSWPAVAALVVLLLLVGVLSTRIVWTKDPSLGSLRAVSFGVALVIGWSSTIFGPLVLTPTLAVLTIAMFMLETDEGGLHRWFQIGGVAVIALPFAAELLGLVPPSMTFADDRMVIHGRIADLTPLPTTLLLLGSSIAAVLVVARTVATVTDALRATRRKVAIHAWHLNQLLPRV